MRSIYWCYFPVTLNDPIYPKTTPFSTFCIAYHIFVVNGDTDFKLGKWVDGSKCYPIFQRIANHL